MGILKGNLSVRRFRVVGEVPDGFRDVYRDQLNDHAFGEPPGGVGKEEVHGWVQVHNLLDAQFDDLDKWLYDPYALFALRVDKKSLPAALFRATLDKECLAWCADKGVEKCPREVKTELHERLESRWLDQTLPSVRLTEICWHMTDGWLVVHSHSDKTLEVVRKLFYRTFGLKIVPWSPLDWLDDEGQVDSLLQTAPTTIGEEVAA